MLKTVAQVEAQVSRRLSQDVFAAAVREARRRAGDGPWPLTVALGRPSRAELVAGIDGVVRYGEEVSAWAVRQGLEVTWEERRAGGLQRVPTHVVVDGVDSAARVAGREAARQLGRARTRALVLAGRFPSAGDETLVFVLRRSDGFGEVDFALLVEASAWFASHDAAGMTPRQVPLPGFHAKWLDSAGRRSLVCALSGRDDLGLAGRPALVEFAYLDPAWLASGGRRYDSHVAGDRGGPAYSPSFVLVVENKDTYLAFPQVTGGICVFGAGMAGVAALPEVGWVVQAPRLLYWGDMDAAGLEILDAYRQRGLDVESVLMDLASYEEFERFGTSLASGRQPLASHAARDLASLTADEQELYDLLTAPDCPGPRRIEQERIPLPRALDEVRVALGRQ